MILSAPMGATKVRRNADGDRWRCKTAKMATLGERPAADRSGLRRATGDGLSPGFRDSGSVGPGPDMVLPSAGTLREPQPRPDRRERQLYRGCRERQRVLSQRPARTLSHRARELRPGLQSGQGCRPCRRPAALRQDSLFITKRRLTWPNGAIATTYSADEPERLRGPQHDAAWCDEIASWRY